MKKVYQSIVNDKVGDCTRAVIASLLDADLEMVPHFNRWNEKGGGIWFEVLVHFMRGVGWQYESVEYIVNAARLGELQFPLSGSINGYFYASVPSKTFENVGHAVVMDTQGLVVHDVNPNEAWLGINIIETGEAKRWYLFSSYNQME